MDITIITQPKEVYNKVIYTFEAKIKDEVYSVAIYDIMEQLFYHDDFNYYERSQWQEDRVFTIETE
jgi:hypothetical protein